MNENSRKLFHYLKKQLNLHSLTKSCLDFSLVNATHLDEYQLAMITVQTAVKEGEITQEELKEDFSLI